MLEVSPGGEVVSAVLSFLHDDNGDDGVTFTRSGNDDDDDDVLSLLVWIAAAAATALLVERDFFVIGDNAEDKILGGT